MGSYCKHDQRYVRFCVVSASMSVLPLLPHRSAADTFRGLIQVLVKCKGSILVVVVGFGSGLH